MANQYINKIVVGGETKLDLTGDTVVPEKLAKGYKAHDKSGAEITGTMGTADISLGIIGASVGNGVIAKSVDADEKPVEWESVKLAKSNGTNLSSTEREAFRTQIGALPGAKIYCKDSDGKILAYMDKECTLAANYTAAMALADYGNSLLIYGNKTYQCAGFESPASAPGALVVAVYFRVELTSSGAVKTEVAKFNPMDYISGTISSPVTITELIPASEARVASVEEDAKVVRTILLGEEEETK